MSFPALYTTLAVWGASGPSPTPVKDAASTADTVSATLTESSSLLVLTQLSTSETTSVTLTESSTVTQAFQVTILGVGGTPVSYYDVPGKAPSLLVPIISSDTVSVQWTEDPVTSNSISSQDVTTRVSVSETSQLFNVVFATDTVSASLSETIALVQSGVTPVTTSDTVATSVAEISAVNVTVVTADAVSVSLTDTSNLSTSSQSITASDTVSISVGEGSLIGIFSGILQFQSSDDLIVDISEVSTIDQVVDRRPMAIRIIPLRTWISISPL